jgi:hypothetical protein
MKTLFIVLITCLVIGGIVAFLVMAAMKRSNQQCIYVSGGSCVCDNKKSQSDCSSAGGVYSSTGKCQGDLTSECQLVLGSCKTASSCTYPSGKNDCQTQGGTWAVGNLCGLSR